jgi:hypothetical protein
VYNLFELYYQLITLFTITMTDFVNDHCRLCRDCRRRNDPYNVDIITSATETELIIDGTLHQHRSRGATAFDIVASTGQVYVPHIRESQYSELAASQDFERAEIPIAHLLLHMVTGSILAIPTDAGVMLVRLDSGPITGPMTGRLVFSPTGRTTPYCGGAEGADSMLHVDGAMERPGCTQPFHTVYRNIAVIGYLRPGSHTYSRIMATRQVTTTVKLIVSLEDIKPTLAEAMSDIGTVTATGPGTVSSSAVSSNSAASSSVTMEEATAVLVCECYPASKSQHATVAKMLATAYKLHGSDLMGTLSDCDCAICTNQIGQCVECFGALLKEEEEEECV